ncbi:MAG: hypothetical protein FWD78_09465 [Treponema sp.]|nr:hypothetical protein [Treponema sp.]
MYAQIKFDRERVAQARDLRRRWYDNEKIERTPFVYTAGPAKTKSYWRPGNPYTISEMIADSSKAVEAAILMNQYHFDTFPDCDYLPVMSLGYLGEGILPAMYGAKQYITEKNPPFTEGRLFKDIYEAQKLSNDLDFEDTEWGKILKEHITRFIDATKGEIPVAVADHQSPYGLATKLVPNEELMYAMYDAPELVHNFLDVITDGIIKLVETMERWIGPENLAMNPNNPIPGKGGIIIWDDFISVLNPAQHIEFCVPCNKKLFKRFGRGHLHTCGPYFPGFINACIACEPRSMDVSIMRGMGKTREDLIGFLHITKEKNIRLFGKLAINDSSIFEKGTHKEADYELLSMFVKNGYLPVNEGRYEDGIKFKETVARIDLEPN